MSTQIEFDIETDLQSVAEVERLVRLAFERRQSDFAFELGPMQFGVGPPERPNQVELLLTLNLTDITIKRAEEWIDEALELQDDDPVPKESRRTEEIAAELIRIAGLLSIATSLEVRPLPPGRIHARRKKGP